MTPQPPPRQAAPHPTQAPQAPQHPAPAGPTRVLRSDELLLGARAVDIEHNGARYRLQATRLGKLILTK